MERERLLGQVFTTAVTLGFQIQGNFLKSDNLQYNMLGRWVDGTNNSSTKRLMFQALFFFRNFL